MAELGAGKRKRRKHELSALFALCITAHRIELSLFHRNGKGDDRSGFLLHRTDQQTFSAAPSVFSINGVARQIGGSVSRASGEPSEIPQILIEPRIRHQIPGRSQRNMNRIVLPEVNSGDRRRRFLVLNSGTEINPYPAFFLPGIDAQLKHRLKLLFSRGILIERFDKSPRQLARKLNGDVPSGEESVKLHPGNRSLKRADTLLCAGSGETVRRCRNQIGSVDGDLPRPVCRGKGEFQPGSKRKPFFRGNLPAGNSRIPENLDTAVSCRADRKRKIARSAIGKAPGFAVGDRPGIAVNKNRPLLLPVAEGPAGISTGKRAPESDMEYIFPVHLNSYDEIAVDTVLIVEAAQTDPLVPDQKIRLVILFPILQEGIHLQFRRQTLHCYGRERRAVLRQIRQQNSAEKKEKKKTNHEKTSCLN